MTKDQVAQQIIDNLSSSKEVYALDKPAVTAVINQFTTVVMNAVSSGESVFIRGFGTFSPIERKAKKARNIKKGEPLNVPAHMAPKFQPAGEFKEKVKQARTNGVVRPNQKE